MDNLDIELVNTILEHVEQWKQFFSGMPAKEFGNRCMEVFSKYIDDPNNKIRVHGGFIPKKQKHYLENEIFLLPDTDFRFIVAFQPRFYKKVVKGGTPLTFLPYITHVFNTKGGKIYLQCMMNESLTKKTYIAFTGHFFDRYSLRVYNNSIGRNQALANFCAMCSFDALIKIHDDSEARIVFADGLGLGDLLYLDADKQVILFKTFITDEMAGDEAVKIRKELKVANL